MYCTYRYHHLSKFYLKMKYLEFNHKNCIPNAMRRLENFNYPIENKLLFHGLLIHVRDFEWFIFLSVSAMYFPH